MNKKIYLFLMLAAAAHFAVAQRPFDLYKTIIDKNPFGPPPADPTVLPEKSARGSMYGETGRESAKEIQQLEKAVSVSAIVHQPSGSVMVGFSDTSNPGGGKHYYLAVGETKDGWAVVSADTLTKKVVLEKDSIQIERVLGEKSQASTPGAAQAPSNASDAARPSLLSGGPKPLLLGGAGGTMRSRRQRRLEEERQQAEQARKAAEEVAAQQRSKDEAERAELRQSLMDLHDEIKKRREERSSNDSKNDARVDSNQDGSN